MLGLEVVESLQRVQQCAYLECSMGDMTCAEARAPAEAQSRILGVAFEGSEWRP